MHDDYTEFLKQDGRAEEEIVPSYIEPWFCEQFDWGDVERLGVLVKQPSEEDVKRALDFYRVYKGGSPSGEYRLKEV